MDADRDVQADMNEIAGDVRAWLDKNVEDGGCCDFCSRLILPPNDPTIFKSRPVRATVSVLDEKTLGAGAIEMDYGDDWLACPTCATVVRLRDAKWLARHALTYRDSERVGPLPAEHVPEIEANLVLLYESLFAAGLKEVIE